MSINLILTVLLACLTLGELTAEQSFYSLSAKDVNGELVDFSTFSNYVSLVINVASK